MKRNKVNNWSLGVQLELFVRLEPGTESPKRHCDCNCTFVPSDEFELAPKRCQVAPAGDTIGHKAAGACER